jgi:membrane-associated protease RseP (regulator of RpoE activity)
MDSYTVGLIVLGLIIAGALFFRDRKGFKVYGPLVMYRTKRGLNFIDRAANFNPRFWKAFSTFGVVMCFVFMAYISILLIQNTIAIFTSPEAVPGATLVIPGVTIPFWWGVIALITVLVSHEFSHAIIARAEGLKVKSVGMVTLGFIPIGAFAEPDEKELKKAKMKTQLRVYAAGSFMNIVLAFAVVLAVTFLILPAFTTNIQGAYLAEVVEGSPAQSAGLENEMILTYANGAAIVERDSIAAQLDKLNPGDKMSFRTSQGNTHDVVLSEKEGAAYIGINFVHCSDVLHPVCSPAKAWVNSNVFWFSMGLFNWIVILNFGIGLFNLLPLKPFDGSYMIESITRKYSPNVTKPLIYTLSIITLAIVLVNILGPSIL